MQVYANQMTIEAIMREFFYVFAEKKYPGVPDIQLNTIDMQPFTIGDINIIPILVWHLNMPVYGFRFGSFTYITDANKIEKAEKEKIKGTGVIVLNALRQTKHISHFSLPEAVELAKELKIPIAYFTHVSHQMGLHKKVNTFLPNGIQLAYDGLIVEV
jgi:phosphoribosyl 1,2-cyclic phosphate phosphodiesterase